jgi:predicted porin
MKKTLIALAAVAVSSAAMSQATIYGVLDVGIVNNGTDTTFASGLSGTSRLGFKGTEDLGGGLKAGFVIETGLSNKAARPTSLGDRGAHLSLSGGFGTVQFGAGVLSAAFFGRAATDPTGTSNYAIAKYAGSARNNSSINYTSPNMGGAVVRYSTVLAADNGTTDTALTSMSVVYSAGALTIGAAAADNGLTDGDGTSIGAAYNLGVAKVFANRVTAGATATAAKTKYSSFGFSAPMGAVTLQADFRSTDDSDADVSMVAAVYALSKSTSMTAYTQKVKGAADASYGVGLRKNF